MDPQAPRSRIEKVRIDSLRVPPVGQAQRPFREAKGDQIAAAFDIDSFGFPVVCRVDSVNWLVDGQHRIYAIQKSGYAQPADDVACEVYDALALPEMARLFLGRNSSTPVSAFERFGGAVTAGYPVEVAITEIVGGLGLQVGYPRSRGCVFPVTSLRRVYDTAGPEILQRVLRVLRDAYQLNPRAFTSRLIQGLALVLGHYSRIDDDLLVRALNSEP